MGDRWQLSLQAVIVLATVMAKDPWRLHCINGQRSWLISPDIKQGMGQEGMNQVGLNNWKWVLKTVQDIKRLKETKRD